MSDFEDRKDNVLRFERHFDGPPDLVFDLWARPEYVAVWFAASHGFRAEVVEYDVRPGGVWRILNRKGDLIDRPHGVFHEVVQGRKLVYSYQFEGTDFHCTVSVELTEQGGGTWMRFCQTGFPDVGSRDDHEGGWGVLWRIFGDVLLAQAGLGEPYTSRKSERVSGVVRDLEEARRRFEEEKGGRKD